MVRILDQEGELSQRPQCILRQLDSLILTNNDLSRYPPLDRTNGCGPFRTMIEELANLTEPRANV